MCGITGFLAYQPRNTIKDEIILMSDALQHRGPDASGHWQTADGRLAFGHRRLSIQDLSANGGQPMTSGSGRFVIAFNGEIYNFLKIRNQLEKLGYTFNGGSDTEVMLAAFEEWGIESALKQFEGMFAFSLLDQKNNELYLCRDRLGEKPLFYAITQAGLVWASELQALTALPFWDNPLNPASVVNYFKYGYVPTPLSIYQNCYKLVPGSILKIPLAVFSKGLDIDPYSQNTHSEYHPVRYWAFSDILSHTPYNAGNYADTVDELDVLLADIVRDQMISDVPYGAFLSGGIDSSLVTSVMQSLSEQPINTFTIGFTEKDYNEAEFAAEIARHLNTHHHELYISSQDCLELVPKIPDIMGEPFADSSILPSYFVCAMAREKVTVCLSGDAGDELFCGYNRYTYPEKILARVRYLPAVIRRLAADLLLLFPPVMYDRLYAMLARISGKKTANSRMGLKLQKLARLVKMKQIDEIYEMLVSYCYHTQAVTPVAEQYPATSLESLSQLGAGKPEGFIHTAMAYDTLTYLPDDNLTKVDRASMASSLETRLPLLNHRFVEKAWTLPLDMKLKGSTTKRVLRDILYKRVPRELIERPKMGFSVPIADWLKGPLQDWATALLTDTQNLTHGYLNQSHVKTLWQEHSNGKRDHSACLWNILMFQAWYARNH